MESSMSRLLGTRTSPLITNSTSTCSTYLDTDVLNGTTYYYVVRPVAVTGGELCQSNEASATPTPRVRRR